MLAADPALHDPAQPPLGDAARAQLLAHSQASARLLEPHHVYPRELVRAITEHHERLDGSGYPRGLDGEAISAWGRVLSITEVVSAMFDDFHARLGGWQRSLADAGTDAAQLGWLAAAAPDARLRAELVLIGREASWFDRVEALVADA